MQEMLSSNSRELISKNPLFANLSPKQLDELLGMMYEERTAVGANIVEEGDPGDTIYIITSGTAEVLKEDDHGKPHHLAILKPGDVIGEISLIDKRPRSATVRAIENMQLVGLNVHELEKHSQPEVSLVNILKVNLAQTLTQNIRNLNAKAVTKLRDQLRYSQKQVQLGQYIFRLMTLICMYVLAIGISNSLLKFEPGNVYLSIPLILLFAYGFQQLLKKSDFHLRTFGWTTDGWEYAVKDSLLLTFFFMMPLIVLVKLAVVTFMPSMHQVPIFFYAGMLEPLAEKQRLLLGLSFMLYVPAIEFMARGVSQTSFMTFLNDKHRKWQAIVLAALFFSLSHSHVSVSLAIFMVFLNLFFGWLYTRHSTLIGVIVSHLILSYFAIFIVGFNF